MMNTDMAYREFETGCTWTYTVEDIWRDKNAVRNVLALRS